MSYDADADSERAHKTGRITILSILVLLLGLFVFLFKIDACSSKPENCKDEFFEIKNDYTNNHACSPGAVAEVVNSPPAPKPGIICHCPGHATPAASPSAH